MRTAHILSLLRSQHRGEMQVPVDTLPRMLHARGPNLLLPRVQTNSPSSQGLRHHGIVLDLKKFREPKV